jgi:AraC-like DNA-binding protein/Tfp pilus assembly protein PilF
LLSWFVAVASAYGQANVYDNLKIKQYERSMNSLDVPKTQGCDSVIVTNYDEIWYFNIDTLCYRMATEGYSVQVEDLMHHFLFEIADYATAEQLEKWFEKMETAAKKYNNNFLRNKLDYMKTIAFFYQKLYFEGGVSEDYLDSAIENMQKLKQIAVKQGNKRDEVLLLSEMTWMYMNYGNYAKMFKNCPILLDLLENTTYEEYPLRNYCYFFIGNAYYRFRDYKRAIPCLKAALHDTTPFFADRSDLRARSLLADYYSEINDLDSSDYYYRSIYDSPLMVRFRPYHDVKAVNGIAHNLIKRGNYNEALQLLKRWQPEAIKEKVYETIFNITIAMGECYIAEKQPEMAKAVIDDIRAMDNSKLSLPQQKDLYILLFHYYSVTGNITQAQLYVDSIQTTVVKHEEKTDALIILRAEQELFESEKALKDETIQKQKNLFQFSVVIFVLCLLILIIVVYNYRKKQIINKKLVQHIREQDFVLNKLEQEREHAKKLQLVLNNDEKTSISSEDDNVFNRFIELMKNSNIYTNAEVSRKEVAGKIGTNETYLGTTIKQYTGMTFTDYINEFRLNYARNLFLENKLSVESIAFESGFGSRRNFLRLFSKRYGLSPTSYRKQLTQENS